MKLRLVYTTFSLIFLVFLTLANSGGRAGDQNWGNTGAPGDETLSNGTPRTCQSCHATGDIQVTLDVSILDSENNPVISYIPNEIYTAKVKINHAAGPMPNGYGFQLVSLFDKDTGDVQGWMESGHSVNVQIETATNTNRIYAEHKGVSDVDEFLVQWQAPAAGNGEISFYAAGIGANRNGAMSGDGAATPQKLTLSEGIVASTQELLSIGIDFNIAPNPITNEFTLTIDSDQQEIVDINLLTINGQVIYNHSKNLVQGNNKLTINTGDFPTGLYFLQISNEQAVSTKKVIKY